MTVKLLPEHIDPFRYAEQNLQLEGFLDLVGMIRLSSSLNSQEGKVTVKLQFGIDEQNVAYLKGHLETTLDLQCQRCLEPFNYAIISSFVLGIVRTLEDANALPDSYEPLLVAKEELALKELIEDELILNLPIIPKHELENCKVDLPFSDSEWEMEKDKKNPFHVLKSLKHKQHR